MTISKTKQNAIIATLFMCAGVGVAAYTYYLIDVKGAELEEQMEAIGQNELTKSHREELLTTLSEFETEQDALAQRLLTESETIGFLSTIEGLARDRGLTFTTDSLTVEPLVNPQFESVVLRFRAEGQQIVLYDFLEMLETLPYYSWLSSVQLTDLAEAGWSAAIELHVGLHTYDNEE